MFVNVTGFQIKPKRETDVRGSLFHSLIGTDRYIQQLNGQLHGISHEVVNWVTVQSSIQTNEEVIN